MGSSSGDGRRFDAYCSSVQHLERHCSLPYRCAVWLQDAAATTGHPHHCSVNQRGLTNQSVPTFPMTLEEIKQKPAADLSMNAWLREVCIQLATLNEKKGLGSNDGIRPNKQRP